jgi:hypothetical protein
MPSNVAEDERHAERYAERTPLCYGERRGVRYEIYRHSPHGEPSHYGLYFQHEQFCDCWLWNAPPVVHGEWNYGPTLDDWIGCGTLHEHDHNYDDDMEPLPHDFRREPIFDGDTVWRWTPTLLEDAALDWIDSIASDLADGTLCPYCSTEADG